MHILNPKNCNCDFRLLNAPFNAVYIKNFKP